MHVRQFIEKYYPQYYGWFEYPADKAAPFCKIDREWGVFSNFAHTPVIVGGVTFDNTEKLFQVMKFADRESRKSLYELTPQMRKGTVKMQAKHFEKVGTVRPDWGEIIVDALKFCLMAKYEQSETFRSELARSGDRFIVEVQANSNKPADTYSAKLTPDRRTWSGPNLMGRLLMELRDNGKLDYSLPADATDFSDLL